MSSDFAVPGILAAGREAGHDVCGGNISGMFGFFFCKGPVTCFEDATGWFAALIDLTILVNSAIRVPCVLLLER